MNKRIIFQLQFCGLALSMTACGSAETPTDTRPTGKYWSFEEPHHDLFHRRSEAQWWDPRLPCSDFPLAATIDFTTSANLAVYGRHEVWGLERPHVWIVPRGFFATHADHYFECKLDGLHSTYITGDLAFSCRGGAAIPLEVWESGRIRPDFGDERWTTLTWSFYDADRQHLGDFEYEFYIYRNHEQERYGEDHECYRLDFKRTVSVSGPRPEENYQRP